ncbi:MAG: hypothetical protein M3Z26_02790 [Bacteroidota bacterium]|nr:hypothetical protein [Bacteroidota bacterium]
MKNYVLKTVLIAGSLDILAAFIQVYVTSNVMPSKVLQYVASGVFGQSAFEGGFGIQVLGLFFHFVIVFFCTIVYFFLYSKFAFLRINWIANSVLIAFVAWAVTNLIIIPLSKIPNRTFTFSKMLIAVTILIVCIGLPISYFTRKFYNNKNIGRNMQIE